MDAWRIVASCGNDVAMIPRVRASAVCVALGHVLVVRLKDPVSNVVFSVVPGGLIEPGETPAEAAVREVREETGVRIAIESDRERVASYPFTWAGTTYDVTTHFFRAGLLQPSVVLPELRPEAGLPAYQLSASWVALNCAERELGFHSAIWAATRALLS